MNIIEKLKQFKTEVTPEMEKAFAGDVLSELEVNKKLSKLEVERDNWKKRAEEAEDTLKGLDGKNLEDIEKDRDAWKKKAEDAEKEFKERMEKRDYSDAVKEAVEKLKFSSSSAKKAFVAELESDPLKMKDGKLLGFDDFVKTYKENDATAFVDEKQQELEGKKAKFTDKSKQQSGSELTKEQIMAVTDRSERRKMIYENMDLFGKGEE